MRIVIVGAGAVGGIVAWHLARAGQEITILARPATAETIRRDGLTLTGPDAGATVRPEVATDAATLGAQGVVFAGLKGHDWPDAATMVAKLVGPETVLVPIQNGIPWWFFQGFPGPFADRPIASVDPTGRLAAGIPPAAVIGAVAYVGAVRQTAARIAWNGRRRFILGEPTGPGTPRLAPIVALLNGAGLQAEATADIRRALWDKLLGNVNFNPVSALTGATMGRLADHAPTRAVLRGLLLEALAVGTAFGVAPDVDIEARLTPAPMMRDFETSMLQDLRAGRPLELTSIVDAVIELAGLVDVPTPLLRAISALTAARSAR